ncbi:hypothetical protein [Actinoplanes couchii]|uniref:hypothetical protein n=1 Tax=Actinoplanes couchii TaxID=403638 RepID=UPI001EF1F9FA|nr:hypothetical protein [Actinoplanes couchii]MDR6317730.1 hypothetical protein [Actinoplanes couchii]
MPLAMAGAAAVKAASDRGADGVCQVRTRMRDVTLLADALRDTGAAVVSGTDRVTARWEAVEAVFTRDTEGIWGAHFTGADQARAMELVTAVDGAYGRRVQRAVLERLRDQAPAAGLRLESETVDDNAGVRLVFEVERT